MSDTHQTTPRRPLDIVVVVIAALGLALIPVSMWLGIIYVAGGKP